MILKKAFSLKGEISVPGDKSISHRAVMLGAISEGVTTITHFLRGADCLSTISCFRNMGVRIEEADGLVRVYGNGLHGLKRPDFTLDVGNSGTTLRLMSGILAGQMFTASITGDASIQKRPMKRIMEPLTQMGARIASQNGNGCAPLMIQGAPLKGICYHTPVASAQVKSAVLLAGLYADGETAVVEPWASRDHTERMLAGFGAGISRETETITRLKGGGRLCGQDVSVPGDISSAAYFLAAALVVPHSEIHIKNTGLNPTRDGILRVLREMGADIAVENRTEKNGEPAGDLTVRSSSLKGTVIGGGIIPSLIDELPILAVLACFADGQTVIRDAAELKVKESNRIDVMAENLTAMGADVIKTDDGMIINGGRPLHGAALDSRGDHRIAMSFAVAGLAAEGETAIRGAKCVSISYPDFYEDLRKLVQ